MKKRARISNNNPFYSNEPAVSRSKIADQSLSQNSSLGNSVPKMVDKKPGRLSGVAGFSDKHKPRGGISTKTPKLGTPAKVPHQGKKVSANFKAPGLGKKLKV